jgi:hypothetical protein
LESLWEQIYPNGLDRISKIGNFFLNKHHGIFQTELETVGNDSCSIPEEEEEEEEEETFNCVASLHV